MDALSRADRTLAHARQRREGVVTPDSATSPMDDVATVQLPRATPDGEPPETDPEATLVIEPVPSQD
jgi:hypothetical protein